jgi:hypothetical protein
MLCIVIDIGPSLLEGSSVRRVATSPSELGMSNPPQQHGHHTMTKRQKTELNWLFDDGVPFYLAKELIGLHNSEDAFDASYTWRRWQSELEAWGFYSF